jgi:hypothetical protein
LTWAEPFGLGELDLLPETFWHLTPHEFRLKRDGFFRREDRAWEKIATLGQWVLAPHTKKQFTVAKLLGRSKLHTLPAAPPTEVDEAAAGRMAEAERAHVLAQALAWAKGGDAEVHDRRRAAPDPPGPAGGDDHSSGGGE